MAVALTERAAKEVKKIIEDQKMEPSTLLRVGVVGGGCSGFQYSLGFDQKYDEKADSKYDCHGIAWWSTKKCPLSWTAPRSTFTKAWKNAASRSRTPTPQKAAAAAARSRLKKL